jgi:HAD superfamily hydrolase (TIGR01509 family)
LPKRLPTDWTVVTSAEAGAPKPDPEPFHLALRRLAVAPERALHVGDSPADEEGARAAGLHFLPAPLTSIVEGWS